LNREFLLVLVGILGTTISPYLFFWQTAMEVEEMHGHKKTIVLDKSILPRMHKDVGYGMFFSVLVMYFITLTAGSVLHESGVTQIETVEDAAKALRPLAGNFSYALFALGVIGTGLLSVPVLAGCLSYILAETFGWKEGLNKKFHQAKEFYMVIIVATLLGLGINFTGIGPVKALLYTAVLYGITAPVLIGVILHICNKKAIMQTFTNGRLTNIVGWLTLLLMGGAAVLLLLMI
jgi:Mn2+/Fe2+ NRAMP family transporter